MLNSQRRSGNAQRVSRCYTDVYTFRIIDAGKTEYVPARYTFVYENRDGEWLIAHHHSSLMPLS